MQKAILYNFVLFALIFFFVNNSYSVTSPKHSKLIISTDKEEIYFDVEIVTHPADRRKGLQGRTYLGFNEGMLFVFEKKQIVKMWMKGTPLSLDIIFILPDGKIGRIEENTTPFSRDIISSLAEVVAVLEVKAGQVKHFKIKSGDYVQHQMLKNK